MTLTETRPEAADEAPAATEPLPPAEPTGFVRFLATGDHKKIGRTFIVFSLLALLATTIMGLVLSVERVDHGGFEVLDIDTYFQALTMSAQALVFMVVMPLFVGLGIYITPLQVGARTVAFPRAAAASMWGFLLGSVLVVASYAINGGPGGGDAEAVDLWIVSCGILVASLALGALCVVATVLTLRTPGMSLDRIPPFSWSMLVAGILWLLSLPVMLGLLLMIYLDHRYGRTLMGGNFDLYQWLHWTIRPPQVFLWALPAFGILGEIVPVMAQARQRHYKTMMTLVGLVGVLGFGAWTVAVWRGLALDVHGAAEAFGVYDEWLFLGVLVLIGLPMLLVFGGLTDTAIRGKDLRVTAPLVYADLAGLLLLGAAIGAAASTVEAFGLLETTWMQGVSSLALIGAVLAGLGGVHYWGVKIWGKALPDGAGFVTAGVIAAGAVIVAIGELVAGIYDQPDVLLVAANPASAPFDGVLVVRDSVDTGNIVATIGWGIVTLGVAVFLLSFIGVLIAKAKDKTTAEADPWDGQTLEWATSSPPVSGNFAEVALVTSAAPLLDGCEAEDEGDD